MLDLQKLPFVPRYLSTCWLTHVEDPATGDVIYSHPGRHVAITVTVDGVWTARCGDFQGEPKFSFDNACTSLFEIEAVESPAVRNAQSDLAEYMTGFTCTSVMLDSFYFNSDDSTLQFCYRFASPEPGDITGWQVRSEGFAVDRGNLDSVFEEIWETTEYQMRTLQRQVDELRAFQSTLPCRSSTTEVC